MKKEVEKKEKYLIGLMELNLLKKNKKHSITNSLSEIADFFSFLFFSLSTTKKINEEKCFFFFLVVNKQINK